MGWTEGELCWQFGGEEARITRAKDTKGAGGLDLGD